MDKFQSIDSGQGILKDNYGETAVAMALRKKREKLADSKRVSDASNPSMDEAQESMRKAFNYY